MAVVLMLRLPQRLASRFQCTRRGSGRKSEDGDTNTGVERGKAEEEDGGCALRTVLVTEPMFQFVKTGPPTNCAFAAGPPGRLP